MLTSDCYSAFGGLLVCLLRAVVRHVALFAIAKTLVGSVRCTSLHGGVVGHALVGYLLTTLLLLLLALLELVGLQVLTTVPLIRQPLVPLLETWVWVGTLASVTSRGLPLKPPFLGVHLLALIVNHNSVVHQCMEIRVGVRHEPELKTIVQPLEKEMLLLVILSYIIRPDIDLGFRALNSSCFSYTKPSRM